MKAHQLAGALRILADLLKSGPNIEINELSIPEQFPGRELTSKVSVKRNEDLPIALSALLSLSRIDKMEWVNLVSDLGLSIDIRPRDASRDILGKVLRVLEREPEARALLSKKVNSREAKASPELVRALSSLLNG